MTTTKTNFGSLLGPNSIYCNPSLPKYRFLFFFEYSFPPEVFDINQDGFIGGYENATLTWAQDVDKDGTVSVLESFRHFDLYLANIGKEDPYLEVKEELAAAATESGYVDVGESYLGE